MGVVKVDENGVIMLRDMPVGYMTGEKAATVDESALGSYANRWLMQRDMRIDWKDGIIQQLQQSVAQETANNAPNLKVYQLTANSPMEKRFASYEAVCRNGGTTEPTDYACVFEGNLGTGDLDEIYEMLNTKIPDGYSGHSLSVSDVVEIRGQDKSTFHYVDDFGFKEIPFDAGQTQQQKEQQTM